MSSWTDRFFKQAKVATPVREPEGEFDDEAENNVEAFATQFSVHQLVDDVIEDSPAARNHQRKMELKLENTNNAVKRLIKISKQYQSAGNAFKEIALQFGNELLAFNFEGIPSPNIDHFQNATRNLGQAIIDVNDYQAMLMVQMANVFTQPLEQFLAKEFKSSKEIIKQHGKLRNKYDQSITKFYQTKKTDLEKIPEAEHELLHCRNEYQQSSLDYLAKLNRLESTSKIEVIERACAFMYSEKAFFSQGLAIHQEIDHKLTQLSRQVSTTHKILDIQEEEIRDKQKALKAAQTERSSTTSLTTSGNSIPTNASFKKETATETAGYLFQKKRNNWRRGYYKISNGILSGQIAENQKSEEIANLLLSAVKLTRDTERRFCFEVVLPKETLYFQAENEEILEHWMTIIQNAIANALNNNYLPNNSSSGGKCKGAVSKDQSTAASASDDYNTLLSDFRKSEANRYCADCGCSSLY